MTDLFHGIRILLGSTCLFALLFYIVNRLSDRFIKVYRDFSIPEQGDWCSRVNSTIHALVITTGMFYSFMHQDWDANLMPTKETPIYLASTLFSFSCGYFLFDLFVLVLWQVPLWRVFVIHHIVAVLPYLIYTMHSGCGMDLYLLQLFLMVEFAVIPLNITTFMEQLGYGKSKTHEFFFYMTYTCWFGARVLLPIYNVYVLWTRIIPNAGTAPLCTVPAAFCGHIICAFCVGVFVFVWTPDVLAKWRMLMLQMEEYPDYKLTMRQSMTPRSNPLQTPSDGHDKWGASYGTASGSAREPQWASVSIV
ncbi:unnamed protein product [Peronospora belbahrii]|uniref:TLC domain-containing protein n=1 Tax=Peronospora belbahrii TaxID=622444 RepID=A0AAU9KY76_9STRA|nr:unnamed protein product [Peronospora belbahrii]CAH0513950.1 unnamed protein product [Peronospora belbahrii]